MSDRSETAYSLFGTVPDRRYLPKPALEELAEKHPAYALSIADQLGAWAESLGGDLTPQQKWLLGKLAVVELVTAALTGKLAKTGLMDAKGNPSATVTTVRQLTETSLRIGRDLGLVPQQSTGADTVDVQTLWAEALSSKPRTTDADTESDTESENNTAATDADTESENNTAPTDAETGDDK